MIILGFDPGTELTGYGVLELENGDKVYHRAHGVIKTKKAKRASPESRMTALRSQIVDLIKQYRPDVVAAEDVFVGRNRKSALVLAHFRGILLEACASAGHEVHSYTPTLVKKVATGNGRASKEEVQSSLQKTLRLAGLPSPDHAADGLAVCLTYLSEDMNLVI